MVRVEQFIVAVVDDDARVLKSLENLLESAGHSVRSFASAKAFLEHDGFAEIDCLISDISMPRIDGFDLQRLVSAARPELPVILITGREELTNRQMAGNRGNRPFLRKPFNAQDLITAVSKVLPVSRRGN